MKKMKIKNWTNCIQDRNNWKLYVEKPKHSKVEVVAPEEEDTFILRLLLFHGPNMFCKKFFNEIIKIQFEFHLK
jgi:hypothetical protein